MHYFLFIPPPTLSIGFSALPLRQTGMSSRPLLNTPSILLGALAARSRLFLLDRVTPQLSTTPYVAEHMSKLGKPWHPQAIR